MAVALPAETPPGASAAGPVPDAGGDPVARLALEAEGFTAHRTRKDLHRDARRYTELTVWGGELLRFSWEDVMLRPEWVGWAIAAVGERRAGRGVPAPPTWVRAVHANVQ